MAVQRESKISRISGFYALFVLYGCLRDNLKYQGSVVSIPCLFYMAVQGESEMPRISGFCDLFILWLFSVQGKSEMPRISGFYDLFILWLFREKLKCQESVVSMPCLFYSCSGRIWNAKDQWFLCPVYSMAVQEESEMPRISCFHDLFILLLFRENLKCQGSVVSIPCLFYGCLVTTWNANNQWFLCPVYFMAAQGESEMPRAAAGTDSGGHQGAYLRHSAGLGRCGNAHHRKARFCRNTR